MNQIDNYIQSFLNGSLDAERHAALRQWIKATPENRTYFHDTVSIWKATGVMANADDFDLEKAIGKFNKETKPVKQIDYYRRALRMSAAAIIILLCGISSLFFLWQSERSASEVVDEYKEYVVEVPDGAKSKITFPDSSVVWLNAGSKVKYDSNFAKESRNVKLSGEGYFEVSKNKELPFVVNTGKLTVKVLGTKFNLKSYEEDSEVKVTLKEGAVKVGDFLADAAPVVLQPNQRFTLKKEDLTVSIDSVDASHIESWRNGAMVFDKVSLEEITKELKRLYDIPVRIENERLKKIVYYSDFQENVTIEKVLEILSSGNKFRYEVKPELVRIYN
ncbi:MAG: FecR domain-containing protein [Parabacteroides gordonii]|nr:FecR domain-containing protein [Parabacteroides gordonii]